MRLDASFVFYILIFAAVFTMAQAAVGLFTAGRTRRTAFSRRSESSGLSQPVTPSSQLSADVGELLEAVETVPTGPAVLWGMGPVAKARPFAKVQTVCAKMTRPFYPP